MKIYHTETQEDFDALLEELKNEWYSWFFGEVITSYDSELWERYKQDTVVHIEEDGVSWGSLSYAKYLHPNTPIEKYKAKQDEVAKWFDDAARNILKYVSRYEHKNSIEDLKKAQFYLNDLINWMESD
ncbi:DUF3310 domain-containing protein [Listeria monocytogenes]|nr:DUF3310 domain-containing protein [Listeria monocytogenes]EIF2337955.1 DUF3310 domain-containing protein [Listeria monocytogenes]EJE4810023.1 DUF3310 domain-containing protein [Listeria monocytogenes]EJF9328896.1 DUF3310 domain-containing protein [Listeria monocytogenes]EKB7375236.1 DUF3310 domain-containing protein [Listeria monocytogenes]